MAALLSQYTLRKDTGGGSGSLRVAHIRTQADFGADKMRALAKVLRQRALRLAAHVTPARQPHPLNILGPALMAETEAHGNGE